MTDQTANQPLWARPQVETLPLPQPVAFDAPVLIGDCVTPLHAETVLSLLWKRLDRADQP